MLLALQSCELVESGILGAGALRIVDLFLIAMYVVGKVPISVVVLRRQAVRIYGRMNRPGMDLR